MDDDQFQETMRLAFAWFGEAVWALHTGHPEAEQIRARAIQHLDAQTALITSNDQHGLAH